MPTMPRSNDPAVIEHRLLDLAYTTDVVLTAPLLAYYVPCRIEDAERVLDRLASEGRLHLEVDDDGNLSYLFPNRQRMPSRPQQALVEHEPYEIETRQPPNPAAAAILSMIVPGAGQLYVGRPLSGVAWFALVTMGYLLLIVPGVLLHILCVASAAGAAYHWRPSMA
jgi:TM2 domain-containing membrane protein YozV